MGEFEGIAPLRNMISSYTRKMHWGLLKVTKPSRQFISKTGKRDMRAVHVSVSYKPVTPVDFIGVSFSYDMAGDNDTKK